MAQTAPGGYDAWDDRRASDILPPRLLSGPNYRVQDQVISDGFQNYYVVESEFGRFTAQGDAMLRRLVNEIHAIGELKKVSSSKAFGEAISTAATGPLSAVKSLVTDPVDTVSGVPEGIYSIFARVGDRLGTTRSEYEDSAAASVLAVSAFKRDYARQLGVDVYSSNKLLQTELNRIGWAAAAGNLAPGVALSFASGAAPVVVQQLRHVQQLNDLIKELPPAELSRRNRETLKRMKIDKALAEQFLDHKIYSPRHKTIFVESLAALGGAKGRDTLLRYALSADSEVAALFFQQVAETFAGYHRMVSTVRQLTVDKGLPMAFADNRTLVVAFPLDYGRWSARSAPIARHLARDHPKLQPVKAIDVWVTGRMSERARVEFAALGLTITENADERIGMMD